MKKNLNPHTFEEKYDIIKKEIFKKQKQWNLGSRPDLSFEDFASICSNHLYKKWHLFDPKRGELQHWISRIIQSQWINYLRNNYFTLTKPCAGCTFAIGNDECSYTKSGVQSCECNLYKKWFNSKKRSKHEIGMPLPIEAGHQQQVYDMPDHQIDWTGKIDKLKERMRPKLKTFEYRIFQMIYIDGMETKDVEKKLKLKKDRFGKVNKFVQNVQKKIIAVAKDIVYNEGLD
jgi:hypothetical protein